MRILVIDETSAAERFSCTDGKDANIGTGTSSDRLSFNVTVVVTVSGGTHLGDGTCLPASILPTVGTCTAGDTVSTTGGKQPLVTLEGGANGTTINYIDDPTNPGMGLGRCEEDLDPWPEFYLGDMNTGSFATGWGHFSNDSFDCGDAAPPGTGTYAYI
jgi:hypothetical protein